MKRVTSDSSCATSGSGNPHSSSAPYTDGSATLAGMKRKKQLTKRERKAQAQTAQTMHKAAHEVLAGLGSYDIALMGVDPSDPIVRAVHQAMTKPAVKHLLDNPAPMNCALYAQALHASLEDTTGWEFALLVQRGDYHINLWHGDTCADLAMDGDPNKRTIMRIPRSAFAAMMGSLGGVVTYHATHDDLADALVAAGFDVARLT